MNDTVCDLASKQCKPCEGGIPPLSPDTISTLLLQLESWQATDKSIFKTYPFKNYYQTIAFVNALAWISHREDHHPDITVGYNKCNVTYTTHAINGLSENDFICAAKIDKLFSI
ncbi:pterin-4-alpha-carbinolamine dehydratase [Nitrosomonas cryotolerans]|uniref:Putative pterin-4-alpha-carbinolamine dehydratase n=1 Tax=Nitrosomonas cryotolerans ATCC 49181 TaxID=1131553 RepID=A0A1N6F4B9_9PROT|nr:4a-hydroxytetrahydrobiopterin dehydratase [Nitrosomonas cryotolerans]SFP70694.1 pterin-4-alpha-carbinolamine dehydratase [Nitrosomonas cryotolerans]SIN90097.1 pterin-4-alpha-carbinolamine dehydratase [Nitrosomonas cryotolerans ATCC 49181]